MFHRSGRLLVRELDSIFVTTSLASAMRVISSMPALWSWPVYLLRHGLSLLASLLLIMAGYNQSTCPKPANNRLRVESKDFQMLSGLRGVAALVVMLGHLDLSKYLGGYRGLVELGVFMVATFFVLSSFLLSFRALRDDTPMLQYWTKYLLRRFFRVWPLYFFVVICSHLWPDQISAIGAFHWSGYWDSFLLRDRILGLEMAQFWSLRPEVSYYLLIPLYTVSWKVAEMLDGVHVIPTTSALQLPDSERPSIFTQRYAWGSTHWRIAHFTISLVICLCQAIFNPLSDASHQHQYVGPYIPIFWAGTAGALALHVLLQKGWIVNPYKLASKAPESWFSWRVLGDAMGFLIVAGVIASDDWYYTMITGHAQYDHWWSWGPRVHENGAAVGPTSLCWVGVIVSSYILIITVLTPRGINSAILSNSVLVRAGDISFSIYSVHNIVDNWMRSHLIPEWLTGVDCLVVILISIWITAELTHRFVEIPCMRLGDALCRKVDELLGCIETRFEKGYRQVGSEDIDVEILEVCRDVP